jgi:hypothetical protein
MTDAELIARLGLALFGEAPGWQARLADALGVSQRNASRWCRGLLEPPAGIWVELLAIAEGRRQELDVVISELRQRSREP